MAALRSMIVLGMCLSYAYSASIQCDQPIQQFEQCLRDGMKRPDQGQDKQKFEDMKKTAENCFTSNGCDMPQPPQGGPQGGQGGHPQGGPGGNDNNRQCHQAVESKTKDYMLQCMRKSDPTFNFPKEEGHGGPGGPHGGDDHDHEGGPHPGGFGGAGGQDGEQLLLKACKNNQANADKAKACMMNAFKAQAPQAQDQAKMKAEFAAICQAKSQCESKLGATCKDVMEKRGQAMCTCDQEADGKRQEFMQKEPSCQNVQQPPNGGRPGQGKQRDCSQKPRDFCQQQQG